jgi:hypothetical protein
LSGYGFGTASIGTQFPLLYADRDMLVDSVTLLFPVQGAAASTGIVLKKTTAPAVAVTGSTNMATNVLARAAAAPVGLLTFTMDKNNNMLAAGQTMSLFATAFTATVAEPIFVQVRWRSQL